MRYKCHDLLQALSDFLQYVSNLLTESLHLRKLPKIYTPSLDLSEYRKSADCWMKQMFGRTRILGLGSVICLTGDNIESNANIA